MKITIKNYTKDTDNIEIEYLVEREKQTYNNIVETVVLSNSEIIGLIEDEIKTLGFKKVKPVAIRVFEQIEPLNETDNPVDFTLVASKPKSIIIHGTNTLIIGQTFEYSATVYDQYNLPLDAEIIWINKVVEAREKGIIKVTASIGEIITSMDVNAVEKVRTKEEIELAERTNYMLDLDFRLAKIEMGGAV